MKETKRGRKSVQADAGPVSRKVDPVEQPGDQPGGDNSELRQQESCSGAPQLATAPETSAPNDPLARIDVLPEDAGVRLDQFLVSRLPEVSRVRVQQLLEQRKILLNGSSAKPSLKLKGGERIEIVGRVQPAPLRAVA